MQQLNTAQSIIWQTAAKCYHHLSWIFNTLGPRQNGHHLAEDIFKCIFLNENVWIPIKTSLKFVPKGPINNIPSLVQIMAWHRPGDKLLSEAMMVYLPMHICVTRPQWFKSVDHKGVPCSKSMSNILNTNAQRKAQMWSSLKVILTQTTAVRYFIQHTWFLRMHADFNVQN